MFADDQVLFDTSPISLQTMLNDIESYLNTWKLIMDINKTIVLIFEKVLETPIMTFISITKSLKL